MADELAARSTLTVGDRSVEIFRLDALQQQWDVARLPYTLRILLENVLRNGSREDVEAVAGWVATDEPSREISFAPARVLLQDFTGVPAVVDLAAMRNAMADFGGDPEQINPLIPVELVIDHSVQVDVFGTATAFARNVELEFERNLERYAFLRWGQSAFRDFKVVPPGTGIVHQVNLEYLARVIEERDGVAFPDTLVGTDSHTTMVNGLGVLGWGVGGIEAEAAMLGEPLSMLVPKVVGFKLTGRLPEGATATDLVLTVTEILRQAGVVGKFVEYFGHGLASLPLADRATIGNMSPEYGATCGFFPVDELTLDYLRLTGRSPERIALVEAYCKENMLWHDPSEEPTYSQVLELDLTTVEPSLAGPRRPQDRVPLTHAKTAFLDVLGHVRRRRTALTNGSHDKAVADTFPASDPTTEQAPGRRRGARAGRDTGRRRRPGPQARPRRRDRLRARARQRRDRGDHLLHEHVEPAGDGRRRPAGEEGGRARPAEQALGEDEPRPGVEGRDRVLRPRRPDAVPRAARLPHRRLRLHDLHRQLRPARRGDLGRRREGRPRRLLRPLRQPQLRGANPPRGEGELPRLAAARGRLRARGPDGPRPARGAARRGHGRQRRLPPRHLADRGRDPGDDHGVGPRRDVPLHLRRRLHRRRAVARAAGARGRALRVGAGLDLRQPAALLRRDAGEPAAVRGRRRRPLPRHARRLGHDRPHLAGGLDQARLAGRHVPGRARRRAEGLQLLRLAPRQPRGDGARHVRERAPEEPARARLRGHVDGPPARTARR